MIFVIVYACFGISGFSFSGFNFGFLFLMISIALFFITIILYINFIYFSFTKKIRIIDRMIQNYGIQYQIQLETENINNY